MLCGMVGKKFNIFGREVFSREKGEKRAMPEPYTSRKEPERAGLGYFFEELFWGFSVSRTRRAFYENVEVCCDELSRSAGMSIFGSRLSEKSYEGVFVFNVIELFRRGFWYY